MLAIIFPGGIGVREAVLTGFMIMLGITEEQAGTISIISRLWFTLGEAAIFLSAFVVGKSIKL
ncbi:unnamed protein product [marine sediment metagenome]|uniref:Uncharacterized protein n=1 Tax=marine sediment metagenome TaxID=412755 RepID=X1KRJ5_9ZZZZ